MRSITMARIISLFVFAVTITACGAGLEDSPFLSPFVGQGVPVAMPRPVEIVSLAEAQAEITFDLPMPQALPDELILGGARVFTPNHVQYFYAATTGEAGVGIEISTSAISQYNYPPLAGQSISGNGIAGECIQGSWRDGQWHEDADVTVLYWADGGLFYRMSQSGLGYACEDMIHIGESFSHQDRIAVRR